MHSVFNVHCLKCILTIKIELKLKIFPRKSDIHILCLLFIYIYISLITFEIVKTV